MKMNRKYVGKFQQASETMCATDPCYDGETPSDIRGKISGVLPGTWKAFTLSGVYGSWGERVCELMVHHESLPPEDPYNAVWMKSDGFSIGVDSGQAGFFDDSKYPHNDIGEYRDKDSFYGKACELTLGSKFAGILDDFGVVSSSGLGDGCYECYTMIDENDKIVGAKIIFIDLDEENELTEL